MPFENFPYADLHNLNLDWLMSKVKRLDELTDSAVTDAVINTFDQIVGQLFSNVAYDNVTKTLTLQVGDGSGVPSADTLEKIKLNQLTLSIRDSNAQDRIDQMVTDLEALSHLGIQNVLDYGAYGDGTHDDRQAFRDAMAYCKTHGGGIVYVPPGDYHISGDIVIPDNTMLVGAGKASRIYMTTDSNWSGEVIIVCGNNVIVRDISGGLLNKGGPFIDNQPNMGFIGITNLTYENVLGDHDGAYDAVRENVLIENITTDAYYALQAETVNNDRILRNITYRNIFAPDSCVSMQGSYDNTIEHGTVEEVVCGYLRIGTGSGGYVQDITVQNVRCCYCRIYNTYGTVRNITVETDTSNPFYVNGATWIPSSYAIAATIRAGGYVTGVRVDAHTATNIDYGIECLALSGDVTHLTDCMVKNVSSGVSKRSFYASTGTYWLTGCKFKGADSSLSTAYNIGSDIDNPSGTVYTPTYS